MELPLWMCFRIGDSGCFRIEGEALISFREGTTLENLSRLPNKIPQGFEKGLTFATYYCNVLLLSG